MIKVYTGIVGKKGQLVCFLHPSFPGLYTPRNRWSDIVYSYFTTPIVQVVQNPEEADCYVYPYHYTNKPEEFAHLRLFSEEALRHGKKVIVVFPGDNDQSIFLPNLIVFRHSQYKYKIQANEIIMPAFVEDLLGDQSLDLREKSEVPTVGFCGWANYETITLQLKDVVKNLFRKYKSGIYYRHQTIRALQASHEIKTNFTLRHAYAGNEKTREMDPVVMRRDFIQNIQDTDYTLCIKGSGNFSQRFYETLSLGRNPLYIDTNTVLPLEDEIVYDTCILRIPVEKAGDVAKIVSDFHAAITPEEFSNRQKMAREIFKKYLRIDAYFTYLFQNPEKFLP